jgi:hypothetical protein
MAQADLTELTNSVAIASIDRGVTTGTDKPNGGGSFVYGFNSLTVVEGSVGLFANQVNFAPMAKGGTVSAAIKRAASGGTTGWAPFIFIGLQGPDVSDLGYLLGLQDTDPTHVVLRKGTVDNGLAEGTPDPTNNGILRRSTNAKEIDTWYHLRLDMVVNGSGDVILKVFENDLTVNTVGSPVWQAIAGMADFTDDALGINTGTAPYTSGRAGFGHRNEDVTRRSLFDHLRVIRQL